MVMEGFPDEEPERPSGQADQHERPRAQPNLWILIGITILSLVLTILVLTVTLF